MKDMERARHVYRECLKLIPHTKFSFAKVWLLAAQYEIRQLNLTGARKILGNAIGKAPKDKIVKEYIDIELRLGNIDRCRKLYERYEESIDYLFPEESQTANLKFLEAAHKWKKQKMAASEDYH